MLAFRAVALIFALAARAAYGGTQVNQDMEFEASGGGGVHAVSQGRYQWSIEGDKFHLSVDTGGAITHYVFNGRTFYVCSKLNAQHLALAQSLTAKAALDPYKDGACQVVPTNFLIRFFLTPLPSVKSIEVSDGLKLTLGLKSYELRSKGTATSAGVPCNKQQRHYTLSKSTGAVQLDVTEDLCVAAKPTWRTGLWPEVNKAVLRQPGGGDLSRQLKRDYQGHRGIVLQATTQQRSTDARGRVQTWRFAVKTTAIKEQAFAPDMFSLPAGFKVFSPESIALAPQAADKAAKAIADAPEADVFDVIRSVFFCAVTGPVACLAAP